MWAAVMGVPHMPGFGGIRQLQDSHDIYTAFTQLKPKEFKKRNYNMKDEVGYSDQGDRDLAKKTARVAMDILNGMKWPKSKAAKYGGTKSALVPSLLQVGDAIGFEGGKNWVKSSSIANKGFWCPNPDKPDWKSPLPLNYHPSINLAFNARQIHVNLKDLGTPGKDEEPVQLWDAEFAKRSTKEVLATMVPYDGDQKRMKPICPPPPGSYGRSTIHRLELNVTGHDHRAAPPEGQDRTFDETVAFDVEFLPPGSMPKQRAFSIEPEDGKEKFKPGHLSRREGPTAEWVPFSPDVVALLLPVPATCADGESAAAVRSRRPRRGQIQSAAMFL